MVDPSVFDQSPDGHSHTTWCFSDTQTLDESPRSLILVHSQLLSKLLEWARGAEDT